jgi:MFS family permease
MSAVGSIIFGFFSDRFGRKWTIIATTALLAVSFGVAPVIPANLLALYAWTVLYGLSYGGAPEQYAAIITDYYGRSNSTTLFGFLTLAGGIGGGLFPLIGGWLVDQTGNYYSTLLLLAVGMALATGTALLANKPNSAD